MKTKRTSGKKVSKRQSEGGAVRAKLVRIGNSRGVRLPKTLLEQSGLGDEVTLRVSGSSIIVQGIDDPRAGWEEAIKKVIAEHGNELTDEDREWLDAPLSSEADKERTW